MTHMQAPIDGSLRAIAKRALLPAVACQDGALLIVACGLPAFCLLLLPEGASACGLLLFCLLLPDIPPQ